MAASRHRRRLAFRSRRRATLPHALSPLPRSRRGPRSLPGRCPSCRPLGPSFTRTFAAYVDSDKVVGAGVVFMKNGRIVARYDTGFADRTANVRVDDQSIYHWGSITKTLTAISIMQLRDRGKLSLDDKIVRYVPELRTMHDPYGMMDSITLRMLLSHTAGFQNGTWPYGNDKPWEPFEPTTWNQLVAMMPYQELVFKPGSRYGYSNPGFIYLARVIEQITGDPWEAYVQKNIFAPLELNWSYFRSTPYYLAEHRSHNYYVGRIPPGKERLIDNGADFDPGHHVAQRRLERTARRPGEVHGVSDECRDPGNVA